MTQRKRKGAVKRLFGSGSSGLDVAKTKKVSLDVLNGLPGRGSVKAADFKAKFGQDADEALSKLGVTEVSRNGRGIVLKRPGTATFNVGGADIILSGTVSGDVATRSNGVDITNVQGVKVDAGTLIPRLDLKSMSITDLTNGDTRISMKLRISRFLPDLSHTITVDPSGQPV